MRLPVVSTALRGAALALLPVSEAQRLTMQTCCADSCGLTANVVPAPAWRRFMRDEGTPS